MNLLHTRWVLLLMAFAAIQGCGEPETSPATGTADAGSQSVSGKPRVALIMKSLANEFFSTMAAGAETHQKANSDQYELIVNGIRDERDLSRQVALVDEMVAMKVDAIVIAPADSRALVPALRKAIAAGITVINIDNKLDKDVLTQEEISIPFVGPDNRAGARKVGERLVQELAKGDKVAILEGIRTSFNAQQRLDGFKDALTAAGIEIVDSQSADWEMSQANTIASSVLSEHPEIKAILAANDSMALGALAAVKASGRNDVQLVGFDNISAIQEAIREGLVLATADQHGDQLAVFGIEAALKQVKSNGDASSQLPSDLETPVDLVTKESLAETGR
ncbi:MAG: sugar ABC transporter substrate-binding protein [Planctomycetota bacterium]